MKLLVAILFLALAAIFVWHGHLAHALQERTGEAPVPRFTTIDVFVDSGKQSLAAYQVEVKATGDVQFLSLERGDDAGFSDPPYYDPAATSGNPGRIVIGALNLTDKLPAGKTRVARIHVRISGQATYTPTLMAAGDKAGKPIPAQVSISEGANP